MQLVYSKWADIYFLPLTMYYISEIKWLLETTYWNFHHGDIVANLVLNVIMSGNHLVSSAAKKKTTVCFRAMWAWPVWGWWASRQNVFCLETEQHWNKHIWFYLSSKWQVYISTRKKRTTTTHNAVSEEIRNTKNNNKNHRCCQILIGELNVPYAFKLRLSTADRIYMGLLISDKMCVPTQIKIHWALNSLVSNGQYLRLRKEFAHFSFPGDLWQNLRWPN